MEEKLCLEIIFKIGMNVFVLRPSSTPPSKHILLSAGLLLLPGHQVDRGAGWEGLGWAASAVTGVQGPMKQPAGHIWPLNGFSSPHPSPSRCPSQKGTLWGIWRGLEQGFPAWLIIRISWKAFEKPVSQGGPDADKHSARLWWGPGFLNLSATGTLGLENSMLFCA